MSIFQKIFYAVNYLDIAIKICKLNVSMTVVEGDHVQTKGAAIFTFILTKQSVSSGLYPWDRDIIQNKVNYVVSYQLWKYVDLELQMCPVFGHQ